MTAIVAPGSVMNRRGHYCWSCGRMRPNEKFSGRGHARHLCKVCARLGKAELAYRQAMCNLERLIRWDGSLSRRNREPFRQYLAHEDERVRAYAQQIEAANAWAAAERRLWRDVDDFLCELAAGEFAMLPEMDFSPDANEKHDEDIPF